MQEGRGRSECAVCQSVKQITPYAYESVAAADTGGGLGPKLVVKQESATDLNNSARCKMNDRDAALRWLSKSLC